MTPHEAAQRAAEMRTQGREGARAARINMAFSTDNYNYIRTMASATGKTMTQFCNLVIEQYRTDHAEQYAQAKALLSQMQDAQEALETQ